MPILSKLLHKFSVSTWWLSIRGVLVGIIYGNTPKYFQKCLFLALKSCENSSSETVFNVVFTGEMQKHRLRTQRFTPGEATAPNCSYCLLSPLGCHHSLICTLRSHLALPLSEQPLVTFTERSFELLADRQPSSSHWTCLGFVSSVSTV